MTDLEVSNIQCTTINAFIFTRKKFKREKVFEHAANATANILKRKVIKM